MMTLVKKVALVAALGLGSSALAARPADRVTGSPAAKRGRIAKLGLQSGSSAASASAGLEASGSKKLSVGVQVSPQGGASVVPWGVEFGGQFPFAPRLDLGFETGFLTTGASETVGKKTYSVRVSVVPILAAAHYQFIPVGKRWSASVGLGLGLGVWSMSSDSAELLGSKSSRGASFLAALKPTVGWGDFFLEPKLLFGADGQGSGLLFLPTLGVRI